MKQMKNKLTLLLCMMLATAMLLVANGCGGSEQNDVAATTEAQVNTETVVETEVVMESVVEETTEVTEIATADTTVLGEGAVQFDFAVVDADGNETTFEIHTDKEIVGEALLELGLIAGEDGDYGLYVKEVNGITADYDVDGTYWAFYVNGDYAISGVDTTAIEAGASYAFKVEK